MTRVEAGSAINLEDYLRNLLKASRPEYPGTERRMDSDRTPENRKESGSVRVGMER